MGFGYSSRGLLSPQCSRINWPNFRVFWMTPSHVSRSASAGIPIPASIDSMLSIKLHHVDDVENITVRIFEPNRSQVAHDMDVAFPGHTGQIVILFKSHTF